MPSCQYCGQACGNEGARAQHERACDANPENQAAAGGERMPQRRQPQHETAPATHAPGAGMADTLYVLTNFDEMPTEMRRDAIKQGTGVLGNALNRWLDLRERSMERKEQRAKNAQLEPIEELPVCLECDYQFSADELTGSEVRCPSCEHLYQVRLQDTATA